MAEVETPTNPCDPVVPPECMGDEDCTQSCNSKCIDGSCVCEDCPCNSVCLNVDTFNFPSHAGSGPRDLIGDDQENCVDCIWNGENFFCNCLDAVDGGICRPARDLPDGTGFNCDCPADVNGIPDQVCCENPTTGTFTCCNEGVPGVGPQFVSCIDGIGCTNTECLVDEDCGNECLICDRDVLRDGREGRGTCEPISDGSPCGTDAAGCENCSNGTCTSTGSTNCNCSGQECETGFECCAAGQCCEIALGGCNGSGCNECADNADCPDCGECNNDGVCIITDCDPCFRFDSNCECTIPVCQNCETCTAGVCDDTCPVCFECENGNCAGPDPCDPEQILNTDSCVCVDRCLDCENWNSARSQCVVDASLCGCCRSCDEGGEFDTCTGADNSKCPPGDVCVTDSVTGTCNCITPGCDPACTGCQECIVLAGDTEGTCETITPDPCSGTCEECQSDGSCGNPTCAVEGCCLDGSCCDPDICCEDGTCCPTGDICCGGDCCDPATHTCVQGVCEAINQGCQPPCTQCLTCINGRCDPDPEKICNQFCPAGIDWCGNVSCIGGGDCSCGTLPDRSGRGCVCNDDGTPCFPVESGVVDTIIGACCSVTNTCTQQTHSDCDTLGGTWIADTVCRPNPCSGNGGQ